MIHPGYGHIPADHSKNSSQWFSSYMTDAIMYSPWSIRFTGKPKSHVLSIIQTCDQLGHNTFAGNRPSDLETNLLIENLEINVWKSSEKNLSKNQTHLTVEFWLWFYAQHSQWWRHVQISWNSHMSKIDVKCNTPHRQPVWNNHVTSTCCINYG